MRGFDFKYLGLLFLLVLPICLLAQSDSIKVYYLDEVTFELRRSKMFSNINVKVLDSTKAQLYKSQSLEQMLQEQANLVVVNYGNTGVSNVRLRGGMGHHTSVLWNGFNIQDPLLGSFNFSNVSSQLVNEVAVQKGGSSAIYGSGAIGGVVHLRSKPQFDQGLKSDISLSRGSFGLQNYQLNISNSKDKHYLRLGVSHTQLENDFEFNNIAKLESPLETYQHASQNRQALYADYAWKGDQQILNINYWGQAAFRETPPTMVSTIAEAFTNEQFHRLALNWNYQINDYSVEGRIGWFWNQINYDDSLFSIFSRHISMSQVSEGLITSKFSKKHKVSIGSRQNITKGISESLFNNPVWTNISLFLSDHFDITKTTHLNAIVRREYFNNAWSPVTYALNLRQFLVKGIDVYASHSKSHRNPTFNDWYWVGSFATGNPNLEPETAFTQDVGLEYCKEEDKWFIDGSTAIFFHNMKDMIQWLPLNGVWTPMNQKLVWSSGLESDLNLKTKLNNHSLIFSSSYAYTSSTIKERADNESDAILNKQIVYIPFHQVRGGLVHLWKNISSGVNTFWNGKMYVNPDNTTFLHPFQLWNVFAAYKIKSDHLDFTLRFKVNNLLDREYMTRIWYPMPGRNFEIELQLNFKQNLNYENV